jgi:hypothetical protein
MPKPVRRTKPLNSGKLELDFEWLAHYDLHKSEVARLLPTVPGGFTSQNSFFVNNLIPKTIFRGREQASIPPTPGRWYLIPLEIVQAHPEIHANAIPLANAWSMVPTDGPRSFSAWTTGG